MEPEIENAVNKLTRPWTNVLSPKESPSGKYEPVEYPPMIDMLEEAKSGSLGTTTGGLSKSALAERSVMNLQALNLFEWIEGRTRAGLAEITAARFGEDLKTAIRRLADTADSLYRVQQLQESRYLSITSQFPRWCARIWELFDPPLTLKLDGSCPACGEVSFLNQDDAKEPALVAYYAKGFAPEARCQVCDKRWFGERELLELGYHIGATVDETFLTAAGVSGTTTV